ncbi:hypothetical protein Pla108_00420 [Botrimarina colliarenosi]|uniref:Uncharacterized protein n=1 Tax=Botrimarina colliarenosi TaxID=2528001 RepID=A0A5C6AHK1_9BACT|nr:hypothetical protein [Botrimarina colliarenosi]TWT99109.1 hypothetical protein Pla108_00420 [Botrimarina colliarenosi]
MAMQLDIDASQLDRIVKGDFDREYWWSKTPQERVAVLEHLRRVHYGYDPQTASVERVLKTVEL